jgi:hypothetical protein
MDSPQKDAEIITYRIPSIEVYQVTDDELCRVEESCRHVSQDFAFASNLLSFAIAFFIALLEGTFSDRVQTILTSAVAVCLLGSVYTGQRWWSQRKAAPQVIAKIRSRKTEPQAPPTADS